jgi:DNA-binding MarR family transcriptional regulator
MGIEQDIQQKKAFQSVHQKVAVNIFFTDGWLRDKMKSWLSPFGITMKQYNVLRILKGAKSSISTHTLRDRMIDRMSDVSRLVDRMVAKGWISKCVSPIDKRLVEINIESAGLELLQKMEDAGDVMTEVLFNLSEEEAEMLSNLLDKMRS